MPTHDLAIVGGGPRAISLCERLLARGARPRIAMIDRHEVGAGSTWRSDQTSHFLNNTYAAHTTIYPDESTPMDGPLTPGPDLMDWARQAANDPAQAQWVRTEARELQPWSYPTRRLQGVYYREQLNKIAAELSIEEITDEAIHLRPIEGGYEVTLASGRTLRAPQVVLAQGMVQALDDGAVQNFRQAATQHELTYISPGMPAEKDWSVVPGGEPVLTAGMGANFFDIITLLTEGRGGRFTPRSGPFDLEYTPSGNEPLFYVGSRRGLPYRSKSFYGALPPVYEPQLATDEWFDQARRSGTTDFLEHIWPQFLREFTVAHLSALTPQRQLPRELLAEIQGTAPDGLAELIRRHVPDESRWFDPHILDRPDLAEGQTWSEWVTGWVRAERESITHPFTSPRAAVNRAMARLRTRLAPLSAAGQTQVAPWFGGISLALASGPPPERTARLLALVDAGIVTLLGEDSQFEVADGLFTGSSRVHGQVRARAFIETRMSKGHVDVTNDPLLRDLLDSGGARLYVKTTPAGESRTTRTLDVTPDEFRLIDGGGHVYQGVYVLGIPAGDVQPGSAIGATPNVPSPLLAGADNVAGHVAAALGVLVATG